MHQEHDEPQVGYDISGQRYDESTILLDPYGTTVIGRRSFGKLGPVFLPCVISLRTPLGFRLFESVGHVENVVFECLLRSYSGSIF